MRTNAGLLGIVIVSMAVLIALLGGMLSSILPWWLTLLLFAPPFLIWAGAKWPLVVMLTALLAAYGFLPFGLLAADAIVILFVFFVSFVYKKQLGRILRTFPALWWTLGLLLVWGLVSLVYAHFYRGNYLSYMYHDSVSLAYWMIMIPIVMIANDRQRAAQAMYAIIAMAVLLALVASAQSIFKLRLNFSGLSKVAELTSEEGGIAGLARSSIPGVLLLMFVFVIAVLKVVAPEAKRKFLWFLLLTLCFFGIFVTFGRAVWAVTFLCAFLAALIAGRREFTRFMLYGGGFLLTILVIVWILRPEFLIGAANRMLSLQTEFGAKGESLKWRLVENTFAWPTMRNNPIMGIGMGGEYKPRLIDMRAFSAQTYYIHNGYFYITMKTGLIGIALYMLHYFNIMWTCWKNKGLPGVDRTIQIAVVVIFIGTLILNVTQPEFMQGPSIASLASMGAIAIALGRWQKADAAPAKMSSPERPA